MIDCTIISIRMLLTTVLVISHHPDKLSDINFLKSREERTGDGSTVTSGLVNVKHKATTRVSVDAVNLKKDTRTYPVPIGVGFFNHFFNFLIRKCFTEIVHDLSELIGGNLARTIFIEYLKGFNDFSF